MLSNLPYSGMSKMELLMELKEIVRNTPEDEDVLIPRDMYWTLVFGCIQDNGELPVGFHYEGRRIEMEIE